MEYASVKDIQRGFNKLEVSDINDKLKELFTTKIDVVKETKLLDVEEEFVSALDSKDDFTLLGVEDLDLGTFETSSFYRYLATTKRFYEPDTLFISSDWVLPIELVKGNAEGNLEGVYEDNRVILTDNLEGETIEEVSNKVYQTETEFVKGYFDSKRRTIVIEVK